MAARGVMSLDWGVSYDHSAMVVLYRLPGVSQLNPGHDGRPVFGAFVKVWEQGAPLGRVVAEAVEIAERVRPRFVAMETVEVGAMPSQELQRTFRGVRGYPVGWCPVATTAPLKLSAYGLVRWLLERGQLVLMRDPLPLRQLAGIRLEQSAHGTARIGAEDAAVHDDVADALAFAMLPYTKGGRVLCGLAPLADVRSAVGEAPLPYAPGPVVETGAGLRVFARPPLQSVAGLELTMPPGVEPVGQVSAAGDDFARRVRREMDKRQEATSG